MKQLSRSTDNLKTITVIQGEYAISADPDVVLSTVLGSCVAVCIYDPTAGVGGMNHFLLPDLGNQQTGDLKYGVNAMELLINEVLRAGGDRSRLRAKMFGGARMTEHSRHIGESNAAFGRDFLEREAIQCVSQSLGGTQARRIQFRPVTGAARQLQVSDPTPLVETATMVPQKTDITLF